MDLPQKYVSDMLALKEYVASAVKRQVNDESLAKHTSKASQIISEIANTSERQTARFVQEAGGKSE